MAIPMPYPTNHKLTGRVRFRRTWRGKMIAQVEESYQIRHFWNTNAKEYFHWRDANYFDIQWLSPFDPEAHK